MQDGEIPAGLQLIPSSSLGIILNVRFYLNVHIQDFRPKLHIYIYINKIFQNIWIQCGLF